MDRVHDDRAFAQQDDHTLNDRALAVTSGNRQVYMTDRDEFTKRERHCGRRYRDEHCETAVAVSNQYGGMRFPIPRSILGSNDRGAVSRQTLAHRKLWQRLNAPRPYLSHPAYVKYRNRPRKDTDKAGEVIWTDEVEEAFQNALVCIPPMGKKKKSQNGKPHGRNELVSEWIFHETGLRLRRRKQVSSHLQVLDNYLKEVPEWQAVRRELSTNIKNSSDSASDHYFNSVEEVVREVQRMKSEPFYRLQYSQDELVLGFNETFSAKLRLREVDFGMWVSLPNQMDHPLHRYTTLRSNLPVNGPIPLDNISDWQSSFPDLNSIVQEMSSADDFDIVLLDVKLRLMEDFPPETSKLGISLGLDFAAPNVQSTQNYETFKSWICTTHMYQSGITVRSADRKECLISGSRMVKPPFESKWWAFEFTRLTDERRRAQDVGDELAVSAADDSARNYLQNLRVMQQISTVSNPPPHQNSFWHEGDSKRERMAILLWRFSAASPDETGDTVWRRVAPPMNTGLSHCVESANIQTDVPLTMLHDSMDDVHQNMYGVSPDYDYAMIHANQIYTAAPDEEFCHDGFAMSSQQDVYGAVDGSLHHIPRNIDSTSNCFDIAHDFGNIQAPQHLIEYDHLPPGGLDSQTALVDNYFDHEDQFRRQENRVPQPDVPQSPFEMSHGQASQSLHQPLHDFDMNTHKVLQEQLESFIGDSKLDVPSTEAMSATPGGFLHQVGTSEVEEEALKVALLAASALDDADAHQTSTPATTELDTSRVATAHPCISAPIAVRPHVQQHYSFTEVFPSEPHCVLELPPHDVAELLARMEASHECVSAVAVAVTQPTSRHVGHDMPRAHSQPEFLTKKCEDRDSTTDACADGEQVVGAQQET